MYKLTKQYRYVNYDYTNSGLYFVTIVTKDRFHYFGEIENERMIYNVLGEFLHCNINKFVSNEKLENPYINNPYFYKELDYFIEIDEWTILPNHIHLIINIINKKRNDDYKTEIGIRPLNIGSLSSFINHFKGTIKKYSNNNSIPFAWQSRFHDRIIRDENEYFAIKNYIKNNVLNFNNDIP